MIKAIWINEMTLIKFIKIIFFNLNKVSSYWEKSDHIDPSWLKCIKWSWTSWSKWSKESEKIWSYGINRLRILIDIDQVDQYDQTNQKKIWSSGSKWLLKFTMDRQSKLQGIG